LSSRYVEKLAGSVKREKLQHAVDTMDYFYKLSQPRTTKPYAVAKEEAMPQVGLLQDAQPKENGQIDENELDALESNMKDFK
jgi:hypothetical protein